MPQATSNNITQHSQDLFDHNPPTPLAAAPTTCYSQILVKEKQDFNNKLTKLRQKLNGNGEDLQNSFLKSS